MDDKKIAERLEKISMYFLPEPKDRNKFDLYLYIFFIISQTCSTYGAFSSEIDYYGSFNLLWNDLVLDFSADKTCFESSSIFHVMSLLSNRSIPDKFQAISKFYMIFFSFSSYSRSSFDYYLKQADDSNEYSLDISKEY